MPKKKETAIEKSLTEVRAEEGKKYQRKPRKSITKLVEGATAAVGGFSIEEGAQVISTVMKQIDVNTGGMDKKNVDPDIATVGIADILANSNLVFEATPERTGQEIEASRQKDGISTVAVPPADLVSQDTLKTTSGSVDLTTNPDSGSTGGTVFNPVSSNPGDSVIEMGSDATSELSSGDFVASEFGAVPQTESTVIADNQATQGVVDQLSGLQNWYVPVHPHAVALFFGSTSEPQFDQGLFEVESPSKEIMVMENGRLVEKFGIDMFVLKLVYGSNSSEEDVKRENKELIQLFFRMKGITSELYAKVSLKDLAEFRMLAAGTENVEALPDQKSVGPPRVEPVGSDSEVKLDQSEDPIEKKLRDGAVPISLRKTWKGNSRYYDKKIIADLHESSLKAQLNPTFTKLGSVVDATSFNDSYSRTGVPKLRIIEEHEECDPFADFRR